MPSFAHPVVNVYALARYAALCQEQQLVPIVEPEVLTDGAHSIERGNDDTGRVLRAVLDALFEEGVAPEEMLRKPGRVIAGKECQASIDEVATVTLRCLCRHLPPAVPGFVFLSGAWRATAQLNTILRLRGSKPWQISFSYGRALQDPAPEVWHGQDEDLTAGGRASRKRAGCSGAEAIDKYTDAMEAASPG